MFEPTIKYRRVNDPPKDITKALTELVITDEKKPNVKPKETNVKGKEEAVKAEAAKVEAVKVEAAKVEAAKVEAVKVETVKVEAVKVETAKEATPDYTFEEEEDSSIVVDPTDKERIIVTLSTGKQFAADRYCPHAGADLSYHGKVSEHDYPPEIGPVLMCPIHYWEFALEKEGKGGGGWATINACEVKCPPNKLDW